MTADYAQILKLAARFLAIRPRSGKEITDYLHTKTSDLEILSQLLLKLTDLKLINDVEFTRWYVESRSRTNPRSVRLLQQELLAKGIDRQTITDQLAALNEASLARQALIKKQRSWSRFSATDRRLKASRFLAARGFSWNVIEPILKEEYNKTHVN